MVTTITKRVRIILVAVMLSIAAPVAMVPSTASAWGYCSNSPKYLGAANFYNEQGWCGTLWYMGQTQYTVGDCYSLAGTNADNKISSIRNAMSPYKIRVSSDYGCSADPNNSLVMLPGTNDPNLCIANVGCDTISSWKFYQ